MTGPRVALTFDAEHSDRPANLGLTATLLATLKRKGVRATFFVQGRWAEAFPEVARAIAAGGHLVGNHSHYHVRMPLLTDAGLTEDIEEARRVIMAVTGVDPRPWFRCPFGAGATDARVQAAVVAAGYRHVGWHVAGDDWEPSRSPEVIAADVVAGVLAHGDGAVVLLHTWPTATLAALDSIVTRLTEAGHEFCRVDELPDAPAGVPE